MSFDIHDLGPNTTMPELCARLGEMLELGRALPEPVARAAVTRPDYARYLWAARGRPGLLEHLIRAAPPPGNSSARFTETARPRVEAPAEDVGAVAVEAEPAEAKAEAEEPAHSSANLIFQASRSLLRWAAGSFKLVDDEQYERRISACNACEHLRVPAGNLVHKLLRAADPASKVCGLCGCVTAKKARLPHESCPASDPSDPALTRWGEPRQDR